MPSLVQSQELTNHRSIQQLFEAEVSRRPEALAIEDGATTLSYAQLNARADQLALRLRRLQLGHGMIVGLCMERSADYVIGVLGVLKAGATFLPIDPAYPAERVRFMLDDARAALIITRSAASQHPGLTGHPLLALDGADPAALDKRPAALDKEVPETAYVMFTSGTTGRPKAALVYHSGLLRFVTGQGLALDVSERSRFLQLASICFDMSIWEIFLALSHGATLAIAPPLAVAAGAPLKRVLQQARVTHILMTPSALATLTPGELPDLQVLVSAGERCTSHLISNWHASTRFFDAYGATEATVYSTLNEYRLANSPVSVGVAIEGNSIVLLDDAGEPCAPNRSGEIYIGGDGVGGGYLNRPDLTRERFLELAGQHGRFYRTGDLGVLLPDGRLVVQGRRDHQVKLRGYRIELGEIETQILQVRGIQEAVVVLNEQSASGPMLVAFLVSAPDTRPSDATVLESLAARLPEYMVPTRVEFIAALPLTGNGKIDRAALAARGPSEANGRGDARVLPQNAIESTLIAMWQELLDCPDIGVTDDFFELGGHSLIAATLVGKIEQHFGIEIQIEPLFEDGTIRSLAKSISAGLEAAAE